VVFIYPEDRSKDFIKRVSGVSGDTIETRNKKIYLNGLPYNDSHGVYSVRSPVNTISKITMELII